MLPCLRSALLLLLITVGTRTPAGAQGPGTAAQTLAFTPSCAEQGVARVALSVPPGRSRQDIEAALSRGEIFPQGTDAVIIPEGGGLQVLNGDHLRDEARRTLGRLVGRGMQVEGMMIVLLTINADGKVTETTPSSGNKALDRLVGELWKKAEFVPPVIGGCRVTTLLHMPVAFSNLDDGRRPGLHMRWGTGLTPPGR